MTSLRRYPGDKKWESPKHPVYAAEKAALPFGEQFLCLDHVVDYTIRLMESDWWQEAYPKYSWVWIHESNSKLYAWTEGRHIHLPPFAMNESYLLHELAHVVEYPYGDALHHGVEFRRNFVFILRNTMGDWVADNLIKWYEHYGVPI